MEACNILRQDIKEKNILLHVDAEQAITNHTHCCCCNWKRLKPQRMTFPHAVVSAMGPKQCEQANRSADGISNQATQRAPKSVQVQSKQHKTLTTSHKTLQQRNHEKQRNATNLQIQSMLRYPAPSSPPLPSIPASSTTLPQLRRSTTPTTKLNPARR